MEPNEDIHAQPFLHRLDMRVDGRNILTVGVSAEIGDDTLGNTADATKVVGKVLQGSLRYNPLDFGTEWCRYVRVHRGGLEDCVTSKSSRFPPDGSGQRLNSRCCSSPGLRKVGFRGPVSPWACGPGWRWVSGRRLPER